MSNKEVEIAVEIKRETEKAYLVFDGDKEVWIAKSQIKDYCEGESGKITSIFLPEWLCLEKGLL